MVQVAVIAEELAQLRQAEEAAKRAIASIAKGVTELENEQVAHERCLRLYKDELRNMKSAPAVRLLSYRDVKHMEKDEETMIRHIDNQILEKLALKRAKVKELEVTRATIKAQEGKLAEFGRLYEFPTNDQ